MKKFLLMIAICKASLVNAQYIKDTIVVGQVIDMDSMVNVETFSRIGHAFYYSIQHFKVAMIDVQTKKPGDTIIIAMVYNIMTEETSYKRNFGIKRNGKYIFHLCDFDPFNSSFPRLYGRFDDENKIFSPLSNFLIKQYKKIQRIVYYTKYLG